ncbi:MAG: selenocysteine-specific translation elongation factor [Acidobacteria bacterium]|nr:MAG: selenocysteine-specific translation elongation factor [Acidobacteriota bacterium]
MIHRIVGTAGHIDHGKTALVRALTGVETDRLPEEKDRGITIDLGFAPLDLGRGQAVGMVDVPGHERFVRNMLAGAGGIDVVLLVVAADESVKPQTREHFQICRLLGVQAGVIALTKIDMAEPDLLEIVQDEVKDLVDGTFLQDAEMVPCSALTGKGVEDVRMALARCLEALPPPRRPDFVRLPVDRAFTIKGFGTVITGTMLSGRVEAGSELILWPGEERLRVRRVEIHGREAENAQAGQRAALNLATSTRRTPARGDLLATPGRLSAGRLLDVRLDILASCRDGLKDQSRIRFHMGTADVEGRVRLLGREPVLAAGTSGMAQISLASPLAATPGDHFIVRRPSPALTLGGGHVVDPCPQRHRRRNPELGDRLDELDRAAGGRRLMLLLEEVAAAGLTRGALVIRTGLSAEVVERELESLAGRNAVVLDPGAESWVLDAAGARHISQAILQILADFHQAHPLSPGISLQELRRRGAPRTPAPLTEQVLSRLQSSGTIRLEGRRAALSSHVVHLDAADEAMLAEVVDAARQAGLDPPDPLVLLAAKDVDPRRAEALVLVLRERATLLRISDGLLVHHQVYEDLKKLLARRREEDPLFDVSWFKEATGTTRRVAIPLLEYLDADRVTTRRGNQRYIMAPGGARK